MIKEETNMIKAEIKSKVLKGINTQISTEVVLDGDSTDILFDFMSILDAMENECPEILMKALRMSMEDK
jgi:hypothetical protein